MTPSSISQRMRVAFAHQQAGRLAEAERIYRQVLAEQPSHSDALHLLGVIAYQTTQFDAAIELIRRAIASNGAIADYHVNLANALSGKGLLAEAVTVFKHAIQLAPTNFGAHYNLGNALHRQGRLEEAIAALGQATRLKPDFLGAHINLGVALRDKGLLDEAIAAYRVALYLKPDYSDTHNNLSVALHDKGLLEDAILAVREAIRLNPANGEAYYNLGNALREKGKLDEAIEALSQAVRLTPRHYRAHMNLGVALRDRGRIDEAIIAYQQALRIKPDLAEAYNNLGVALRDKGVLDGARAAFQQAIRLNPGFSEAYNGLGNVLFDRGLLDEAAAALRHAIQLKPDLAEAHNNLGIVLKDRGEIEECLACFEQAARLSPDVPEFLSNCVYSSYFDPSLDPAKLLQKSLRWYEAFGKPLRTSIKPHANDRSFNRPLRIGYVSPDFREHPVGRFILPLFTYHDHARFKIYCYFCGVCPDEITSRLQKQADVWRNIRGLGDEEAAEMIRRDGIDILIDLTMHMGGNHLPLFARKPAPVQATYLAYPGTTGLETIDYRITDAHLDPPDSEDQDYSEQSIHLHSYWCYEPPLESPPITPPPANLNGFITFGSLNNFCKITPIVVETWRALLMAAANSRLLLHAKRGSHRERLQQSFAEVGVGADRIIFVEKLSPRQYMETYQRIDIGLDPFPYVGGTTTCDALWMGVPVISLRGRTAIARGGVSILSTINLPELLVDDPADYTNLALDLARDPERLNELRLTLRRRMEQSLLMDGQRFARDMESAYERMWRNWRQAEFD